MPETFLQIILAVIVGGLIGAEREFRVGIGLRTMMLVCLGATLFTIYSDHFAFGEGDPRRIAAAVVTGVGFLGAGMILRQRGSIAGITTAATVWLVAALGMGIGIGMYVLVVLATILVLIVLWVIPRIRRLTNARETTNYELVCPLDEGKYDDLKSVFVNHQLQILKATVSKQGDRMICFYRVYGKPQDHEAAMLTFFKDSEVQELNLL